MDGDGRVYKVWVEYVDIKVYVKSILIFRKECVLKDRTFKDNIVELANNINRENQDVIRLAKVAAGACTDSRMSKVCDCQGDYTYSYVY